MQGNSNNNFFESKVLGHPAGLFVLFFTEMWERFSYYGMRALLVLFLVSQYGLGGWDWSAKQALALYGTYTAMVYLTPILGGFIADQIIGYRKAVVIGALLMTLGHGSMALENEMTMYIGIGLLILGNGFFKPNMTSIISHMYKDVPEKKDGAYTIFYMGVNAGAFLGIMLCGYIGINESWSYGFGLAGIFMFLGMLQFVFAQGILGTIGLKPEKGAKDQLEITPETAKDNDELDQLGSTQKKAEKDKLNPFTPVDKILTWIAAVIAVVWIINDPLSKIGGYNIFDFTIGNMLGADFAILIAFILFIVLLISRIIRYSNVIRDKMLAVAIFAFFTVFFWAAFEQAGGTMTIFADRFTDRVMEDNYATLFIVIDIIITIVPIGIISWVLFRLFKQTFKKYMLSNIILGFSFLLIWGIVIWKIDRNLDSTAYIVAYQNVEVAEMDEDGNPVLDEETGEQVFSYHALYTSTNEIAQNERVFTDSAKVIEPIEMRIGQSFHIVQKKSGEFKYLSDDELAAYEDKMIFKSQPTRVTEATVVDIKDNEVVIEPTWFGILNSLFIIMFAPLFSRLWESRWNPSGPVKYGLGLILLGIGFGALAIGAIPVGKGTGDFELVSVWWLTFAYLFHTLGELCLSPVGLSYVSKLVPGRMIAFMFGVWYLAVAIGNKLASSVGGMVEEIAERASYSEFFLIFTLVPAGIGILAILLTPVIKKFMHGVK
ncbi:MAG: peptide MFS transporter [Crocinitomicaceae bacterium]|nr:peptide MFS transporter [Crocinitomicaceae bacterium]